MFEVLKRNGEKEYFSEEKFANSLRKSGLDDDEILKALSFVKSKLYDGIDTDQIYKIASTYLKKKAKEKIPSIRYSLKRSVMELGPSGFPFEHFIARLYEELGYETKTGAILKGKCINHEIDVIAYKDNELILIEAKFHNESSLKSDTKVALYVKARYDDLTDIEFDIAGKKMKMTKPMLITNTSFTNNSIRYVECVNKFEMISWSYPKTRNLLNMIEDLGIHPITCIPKLSKKDKQTLISLGYVYCKDVLNNPNAFKEAGIRGGRAAAAKDMIETVCNKHSHKIDSSPN